MCDAVKIKSRVHGRIRCGMPHPEWWVTHPAGTFSEQQLAILESDKALQVVRLPGGGLLPEQVAEVGELLPPVPAEAYPADSVALSWLPEPEPEPEPEPKPEPKPEPQQPAAGGSAKRTAKREG